MCSKSTKRQSMASRINQSKAMKVSCVNRRCSTTRRWERKTNFLLGRSILTTSEARSQLEYVPSHSAVTICVTILIMSWWWLVCSTTVARACRVFTCTMIPNLNFCRLVPCPRSERSNMFASWWPLVRWMNSSSITIWVSTSRPAKNQFTRQTTGQAKLPVLTRGNT